MEKYFTDIVADEMQMLGGEGGGGRSESGGSRNERPSRPPARQDSPAPRREAPPAKSNDFSDDFADDDIPF